MCVCVCVLGGSDRGVGIVPGISPAKNGSVPGPRSCTVVDSNVAQNVNNGAALSTVCQPEHVRLKLSIPRSDGWMRAEF